MLLFVTFIVVELYHAAEPILPPLLVKQKVPMLVGTASLMVSMCNFAVMYNFPTWFQTVMLTSASEAGMLVYGDLRWACTHGFVGAHLIPNGVSLALGSLFAG